MTKKIRIFDTTLRDGEQSPGASLTIDEKVEIGKQLAKMKVDVIEAGFPIASPGDFTGVSLVAKNVDGPAVAGLARALQKDIDRAYEALKEAKKPRIHTFIATSDIHMKHKLKKNPDETLAMAVEAVSYAKKFVDDIEFSAEDASRSRPEFLYKVFESVIDAGTTVINVPDTVGYAMPKEFGELIRGIKENVPNIDKAQISVHCHNDLGLAVANSLAAIENGAEQVECTINGIGERAGNAALEELVMALGTRKDYLPYTTGIDTTQIYRTSRKVSSLTGLEVQRNKAIVGANAFAHESGIHQDGVLKERTTYEIMNPDSIGLSKSSLVFGKHSGRHAFKEKLKELGYTNLSDADIEKAFHRVIELADKKKEVNDRDIETIIEDEVALISETFGLEYMHVSSGNTILPTATVKLRKGEEILEDAACGDGPVDAIYQAINRITGINLELVDYSLKAVTGGQDALGEVTVRVKENGFVISGRGTSTDIIEASTKAYIHALNKLIIEYKEK